jgi:serine protease AprX
MRQLLPVFLILLFSTVLFAGAPTAKHVVFLKDKNNNPYSLSNPSAFLSQRALDRRARYWIGLDMKDLPVTPSYVSQIGATGATVVYSLKWVNAVVVETDDPVILAAIATLTFVDHIDQVLTKSPASSFKEQGVNQVEEIPPYTLSKPLSVYTSRDSSGFDYGQALNQTQMISVNLLHNQGYTGLGVWIAILDAGFRNVDEIPAFDSLWDNNRILGTRDFNLPGNNVFADTMHTHGTAVLSTMGANLPGY